MSATLDKIIAEAKALTPDELQQLRNLVDSLLGGETARPHMTEDEFEKYLAAKGSSRSLNLLRRRATTMMIGSQSRLQASRSRR
jgi:hypothetical protein